MVTRLNADVVEVRYKYDKDFEAWVLLTADHHWDNPKCDRALLKKHHEEAKKRGALICCFGDLFCAMQGKGDRRGGKSDLRPEHKEDNYLDTLVNTGEEWYKPYAKNYLIMSEGNHERGVFKYHETDILERLVSRINGVNGTNIAKGKYNGWLFFRFEHKSGGHGRIIKLKYQHGYGGGGPVTKGTIQTNRRATYLPDANIIVSGHVHERWNLTTCRERISRQGSIYLDDQVHIQLPTYKEEYLQSEGYHIETGRPPKPLGGCWLRMYCQDDTIKFQTIWTD